MGIKNLPELLSIVFIGTLIFFLAFPLEGFSGNIVGHFLGIIGTLLMLATLIYVYRKRILKRKGKANPLNPHIYFGLIGGILVVGHSGSKSASLIGVLVFVGMLLTVISGVVGRVLFVKLNRSIKEQKSDVGTLEESLKTLKRELDPHFCLKELNLLEDTDSAEDAGTDAGTRRDAQFSEKCVKFRELAESLAEREERLQLYAHTKTLFTFWNTIHIASTWFLFAMATVHVATTWYYGLRWIP